MKILAGGCLCGAVRYEAGALPRYQGVCYCTDCRKSAGATPIPFMGFAAADLKISGKTLLSRTTSFRRGESVRNHCAQCGALVFGGVVGQDDEHTIYAGTLDDPAQFSPSMAIFCKDRPHWAPLPDGITCFETMPD